VPEALAENLEEYGLELVEDYDPDVFSENACRAIMELTYKALDEWACMRQPNRATGGWSSTRFTPSTRTTFS
jgi:hypothetical protein